MHCRRGEALASASASSCASPEARCVEVLACLCRAGGTRALCAKRTVRVRVDSFFSHLLLQGAEPAATLAEQHLLQQQHSVRKTRRERARGIQRSVSAFFTRALHGGTAARHAHANTYGLVTHQGTAPALHDEGDRLEAWSITIPLCDVEAVNWTNGHSSVSIFYTTPSSSSCTCVHSCTCPNENSHSSTRVTVRFSCAGCASAWARGLSCLAVIWQSLRSTGGRHCSASTSSCSSSSGNNNNNNSGSTTTGDGARTPPVARMLLLSPARTYSPARLSRCGLHLLRDVHDGFNLTAGLVLLLCKKNIISATDNPGVASLLRGLGFNTSDGRVAEWASSWADDERHSLATLTACIDSIAPLYQRSGSSSAAAAMLLFSVVLRASELYYHCSCDEHASTGEPMSPHDVEPMHMPVAAVPMIHALLSFLSRSNASDDLFQTVCHVYHKDSARCVMLLLIGMLKKTQEAGDNTTMLARPSTVAAVEDALAFLHKQFIGSLGEDDPRQASGTQVAAACGGPPLQPPPESLFSIPEEDYRVDEHSDDKHATPMAEVSPISPSVLRPRDPNIMMTSEPVAARVVVAELPRPSEKEEENDEHDANGGDLDFDLRLQDIDDTSQQQQQQRRRKARSAKKKKLRKKKKKQTGALKRVQSMALIDLDFSGDECVTGHRHPMQGDNERPVQFVMHQTPSCSSTSVIPSRCDIGISSTGASADASALSSPSPAAVSPPSHHRKMDEKTMTMEYMTAMELYEMLNKAEHRLMRIKEIAMGFAGDGLFEFMKANTNAAISTTLASDHPMQIKRLTKSASAHLILLG